ncbi:MAG: ABC transporter permease, partial [Erysipelotrichia bacterium]|nr:ABC transporter permease [Erysipelotrichia bacterium]
MRKIGLYFRLAWTNIKANYRLYVPYLIASTGMIMMYYIISMLAMDPSLKMGYLSPTLGSGSFVVALFAISFILYINSFLMKRRTKEFGLYNILGMEKPQIALIVFIETLLSFLIASVSGILIGTIFAKLVQLFLLRLIRYGGDIVMQINPEAVLNTVLIFGVIYAVAYLSTLRTIHKTKPADMLSSSNAGEQEPRAKWILSVIGAAALLGGYWLSQYVQSPMEAFIYFFIAVALVMVGTYLLFTTGSIAILKMLQKNKKFYYQKNHFINVSGMMYRMKQNARGLAQICILSCMVLVTISMTVSLYFGVEDMLRNRYGREVKVASYVNSLSQRDEVRSEVLTKAGNPIQNELYYVLS